MTDKRPYQLHATWSAIIKTGTTQLALIITCNDAMITEMTYLLLIRLRFECVKLNCLLVLPFISFLYIILLVHSSRKEPCRVFWRMGHSGHYIQTCGTLRGTLLGYFKGCYRHVTALSQGCHKSGKALSLGHNNHVVTTMSQFCHRGQGSKYCVAGLLQSV